MNKARHRLRKSKGLEGANWLAHGIITNQRLHALLVAVSLILFFCCYGCKDDTAATAKLDCAHGCAPPQAPQSLHRVTQSDIDRAYAKGRDASSGPDLSIDFEKSVAKIPMRDGVRLHTEIYHPRYLSSPLPILLTRTPYGLSPTDNGYTALLRMYPSLIDDGYIFVFQEVRGRGQSEGDFHTLGPLKHHLLPTAIDESTDAYDTIEWLVKNVKYNTERVGMLGISYGAFLTTRALVDPHPALRAASPQATCADMFIGDDWHHNGAFRLEYSFDWIASMENDASERVLLRYYDSYEAFLALGPLSNINAQLLHGTAPSWNAFIEHPNYDSYWELEMCGVLPHVQPVTVPTLNVAGWFDAEDFYGPIKLYKHYERNDTSGLNYLIVGPWYHGGWSYARGRHHIGPVYLGSDTSHWFRKSVQAPWFAFWLKDQGSMALPEVLAFRTGANVWDSFDEWPPDSNVQRKNLYLQSDGRLSFSHPPDTSDTHDSYISDPENPVPYRHRPITSSGWAEWQLEDQRLADGRPDVLVYKTDPLEHPITISGEAIAHLYASTTGTDSDWVVKLIDLYPQNYEQQPSMAGFQFMVAGEILRGRYRSSFAKPERIAPGNVMSYEINLRSRNHTFQAGHSIMVQIQSTWFPLYDRNPQSYVENIYKAVEEDFKSTVQRVYRSPGYSSHISLPIHSPQL